MKLLGEIKHSTFFPDDTDLPLGQLKPRFAVRAIVANDAGNIALLYAAVHKRHKLPGGGIERDEGLQEALNRELLEEIGCQARITGELGMVVEYRDRWQQIQSSTCYRAKQYGPVHDPQFTEQERAEGFEVVWAKDIASAIQLLKSDKPHDYAGLFIQQRDLLFLQAAHAAETA